MHHLRGGLWILVQLLLSLLPELELLVVEDLCNNSAHFGHQLGKSLYAIYIYVFRSLHPSIVFAVAPSSSTVLPLMHYPLHRCIRICCLVTIFCNRRMRSGYISMRCSQYSYHVFSEEKAKMYEFNIEVIGLDWMHQGFLEPLKIPGMHKRCRNISGGHGGTEMEFG